MEAVDTSKISLSTSLYGAAFQNTSIIQNVWDSGVGPETGYPDWSFVVFSAVWSKCYDIKWSMQQQFPDTYLPTHIFSNPVYS
jgi:hypothetical protein